MPARISIQITIAILVSGIIPKGTKNMTKIIRKIAPIACITNGFREDWRLALGPLRGLRLFLLF